MDKGTQEEVIPTTKQIETKYQELHNRLVRFEASLNQAIIAGQMEKHPDNMVARAIPLLQILKGDQETTRLVLEWVKETVDAKEERIEAVLKKVTQFLDEYRPLFETIKKEREKWLADR